MHEGGLRTSLMAGGQDITYGKSSLEADNAPFDQPADGWQHLLLGSSSQGFLELARDIEENTTINRLVMNNLSLGMCKI